MLIQPQYLDETMLTAFLAIVEGGVRQSRSSRTSKSTGGRGAVGAGPVKAEGNLLGEQETSVTYEDHAVSRLQRLLDAGRSKSEEFAWVEVGDPDADYREIGIGAIVDWECDVYIPDSIRAFSDPATERAMRLAEGMIPHAGALGLDTSGMPAPKELGAMLSLLRSVDVAPVVVGEDSGTEWRVVGSLVRDHIVGSADFDGRVRIVAKVKKVVAEGGWYPLTSLPGVNLLNRQERRALERQGPKEGQEGQFERGPILVVEYLAIFT